MSDGRHSYRFWNCSVENCSEAAAVDIGNCEHCNRHFCAKHVDSETHTCPKTQLSDEAWNAAQTAELEALRAMVNTENLLRRASDLHHGIPCHLDESDRLGRTRMGGMHIHLRIVFSDNTVWLTRILRLNFTSFSDDLSNQILVSECATLRWLENVDIPAPRLYDYGLRNHADNDVGVAFMLIDEIKGRPLSQMNPSVAQLEKVYEQLADIYVALSNHPFPKIGSLPFNPEGEIEVGSIASDRIGTLPPIGPFETGTEYYTAWARAYLQMIVDGQIFARYPVNAYLIFKHFEQLAVEGKCNDFEPELDNGGGFFLKHMDDKGDHIFVDEESNVTGLIDWSFAGIVPVYEAFGPSLVTADMNHLYGGVAGLGDKDRMLAVALKAK